MVFFMRDVGREELTVGEKEGGGRNREIRSFGGRVVSERVAIFFLGVIAVIVVGAFLKSAQGVFIPFVVALLISYILAPPVRFLHKFGVPTSLIVVIMLGLLSGVVFLGIIYLNMSLVAFSKELPELQQKFFAMGKEISESSEAVRFLWRNLADYFDVGSEMTARVLAFSRSFLSIATKMLLVVIFLVFLLVEAPYFEGKLRKALARRNAQKVQHIMETITVQIGALSWIAMSHKCGHRSYCLGGSGVYRSEVRPYLGGTYLPFELHSYPGVCGGNHTAHPSRSGAVLSQLQRGAYHRPCTSHSPAAYGKRTGPARSGRPAQPQPCPDSLFSSLLGMALGNSGRASVDSHYFGHKDCLRKCSSCSGLCGSHGIRKALCQNG